MFDFVIVKSMCLNFCQINVIFFVAIYKNKAYLNDKLH